VVDKSHPEFALTGLKLSSVIRLDKVATVLKDFVVGEIL
jgi:mRNA interferase MazF